jgi:hypothetical protein
VRRVRLFFEVGEVGVIRAILFVVDATNTKLGDSARIWIRKAALER